MLPSKCIKLANKYQFAAMGFWLTLPHTNKQHVHIFHLRSNHRERTYVERQHKKSFHIFDISDNDSS